MRKTLALFALVFMYSGMQAQSYIDPIDNTDLQSNSHYIINPGVYSVADPGNDGILRIDGKENIIIDGSNVEVAGESFSGYFIKISNCSNIEIMNFELVENYYYAVHIMNSEHINIHGCDFNNNKVDYEGWIHIWTDYEEALGGGVMLYQTDSVEIHDNNMRWQNDGVAMYHCNHAEIWNNDFSWNTSFGIRMYFTDSCHIHYNNCSHVNRPYTNPSDCAALLVLVSNENLVEHNDLSHSGDGVFLGQYEHSSTPNNNIFRFNECSYSPHNAIEATFADGNIFYGNRCNYSHYGFWLGYSYNTLVDSNEIIGNQYSGIAVDRGFNNTISNNIISENPNGIELWEGDGIPPYQNQYSHDYFILDNLIEGNTVALFADNTEHLILTDNDIFYNNNGIKLQGDVDDDTLSGNEFLNTSSYHIENQSSGDVYAPHNSYGYTEEDRIACNIWDHYDNPALGEVLWHPFNAVPDPEEVEDPLSDMAEPNSVWYAYPEACWGWDSAFAYTTHWDYSDKVVGEASIYHQNGNGWDVGLQYWPEPDTLRTWSLTLADTLKFWLKTMNNTTYGFQFHHIRVGNHCGGYFKYTGNAAPLDAANGQWKLIKVPLAGGGSPYSYDKSQIGEVSLSEINYVSVHADTWDFGFGIWLDGVHFTSFGVGMEETGHDMRVEIFPNPVENMLHIECDRTAKVYIYNAVGETIYTGYAPAMINTSSFSRGIYYLHFIETDSRSVHKFVKL